jgi:uroporphyrin-III C-methyltransferase
LSHGSGRRRSPVGGRGITAYREAGGRIDLCLIITTANFGGSPALRELSRRLIFVSAHAWRDAPPELDWSAEADPAATLAIPMGQGAARAISRNLMTVGLSPDTVVALVHGASPGEGTQP